MSRHPYNSNASCRGLAPASWDHDTAMLASSLMLVSISEENPSVNVGYKSRLCHYDSASSSSGCRVGSGASLSGWGTGATRQSCKMDLCSLASANAASSEEGPCSAFQPSLSSRRASTPMDISSSNKDQGWGYFTAEGFGRQC